MPNTVESHQEILKEMEIFIQKVKRENPNDGDKVTEMFHKIHEIRKKIPYFQSSVAEFRDFYQNEIENFFDENPILSQKNKEMMCDYMKNECREMEKIVEEQVKLYIKATALNCVTRAL